MANCTGKSFNTSRGCECILSFKKTLTASQILALNTTPIALVDAPGSGYRIKPISISNSIDWGSGNTAYATNTSLSYYIDTAAITLSTDTNLLTSTADRDYFIGITSASPGIQFVSNKGLYVKTLTGDPTNAGTGSEITIRGYYIIEQE